MQDLKLRNALFCTESRSSQNVRYAGGFNLETSVERENLNALAERIRNDILPREQEPALSNMLNL